ncbi:hypothetical protein QUB70_05845 [Microcoleus sp. A003_D6]|uniref:hypothetical protein n=1 Tax=Microcoleus sp. A003_D6 TaxID=3055266 RepID=UPI002FD48497
MLLHKLAFLRLSLQETVHSVVDVTAIYVVYFDECQWIANRISGLVGRSLRSSLPLVEPKLPYKDNNLISLRSSLPLVAPKLPYKGNNLIQSVKPHTALEGSFLLEKMGCHRAISLFTFGK